MNKWLAFLIKTLVGILAFILLDYLIFHSIEWPQAIIIPTLITTLDALFTRKKKPKEDK